MIGHDTAGLIDWLKAAFDAVELGRVTDAEGRIGHAEVRIGDAVVMMFDARPDWPDTPAFLRLYVPDADAVHRRAVEAGGTSVTEVTHLFFGDRVGRVRDPFGNLYAGGAYEPAAHPTGGEAMVTRGTVLIPQMTPSRGFAFTFRRTGREPRRSCP
ncbi:VOC family protein [Nonomuraea longispora]|uniref:VOC family protein n=2 Tax=Nonomuraea longispora TaxID=1848320 RepID=A0A4R4NK20_9ACTN|nr:VOC family protein [Nonomuraea longispora]